jgi:hypothetical protein
MIERLQVLFEDVELHINKNYFIGLLIALCMAIAGTSLKYDDFKKGQGVENIQATYHALLTINSLSSLPFKESLLLPTVNFNGVNDKNIPWAATIKTTDGNYVYTSFPSLGFVAPYFAIRLFSGQLNLKNLFIVNSSLSIITVILFFTTLFALLKRHGSSNSTSIIGALCGCSVMVFSSESLISSGLIYWPQSLSQSILAAIILLFVLRNRENRNVIDGMLLISMISFSMTEWTGYVFCGALFCYSVFIRNDDRKRIALLCFIAPAFAALVFFIQLASVLDLHAFYNTSLERFGVRSASKANISLLFEGYWISFGLYLLFIIPAFYYIKDSRHRFIMILCFIPLLENVILASHATVFTFDRWKLAFPLGLAISLTFLQRDKIKYLTLVLVVASSLSGINQYHSKINEFSSWTATDIKNKALALASSKVTDLRCASIYSDSRVRGYTVMLFMRAVHEGIPTHPFDVLAKDNNVCSVILLKGTMPTLDMSEFSSIEVWNRGESQPHIIQ